MKRLLDLTVAVPAVIVTAPIVGLAVLAVWLWDRKAPIYASQRVRGPGTTFPMYKLRTMVAGADALGGASTADNDRRVTPIGRVLRALKVDELPQLWNVVIGDMSLVGPRAQVVSGAVLYSAEELGLFAVRPGVTDFASIVFADEGQILAVYPDPDEAYDRMIRPWKSRLGLFYIATQRLWVDLALVLVTVVAVISKPMARSTVRRLLRQLNAPPDLVALAGREAPLQEVPPPGGRSPAGPCRFRRLSISERLRA